MNDINIEFWKICSLVKQTCSLKEQYTEEAICKEFCHLHYSYKGNILQSSIEGYKPLLFHSPENQEWLSLQIEGYKAMRD